MSFLSRNNFAADCNFRKELSFKWQHLRLADHQFLNNSALTQGIKAIQAVLEREKIVLRSFETIEKSTFYSKMSFKGVQIS